MHGTVCGEHVSFSLRKTKLQLKTNKSTKVLPRWMQPLVSKLNPDLCLADVWCVQNSHLRAAWLCWSDAGVHWRCEPPARPLAPLGGPLCPRAGWQLGLLWAAQLPGAPVLTGEGRIPPLQRVGSHESHSRVFPPRPWHLDCLFSLHD